jgi:lipopolysaccharide transport system permease protein
LSGVADVLRNPSNVPEAVEIGAGPTSVGAWLRSVWAHRGVLWMLARKDFQVRYKRASLGLVWAVAVPLVQAAVLSIVFSRVVRVPIDVPFAPFVFAGIVAWSYFGSTTQTTVTSIVDGAGLTDKVWFPRVLLPIVPCLANLFSFGVSLVALFVVIPLTGGRITPWLLVLVPATLLLVAFTVSLALVVAALHVYFRDVKFLVTAGFLVWMYITPVVYPQSALGRWGPWLDFNPMTGIVDLFHLAALGDFEPWQRPVLVTVCTTIVLLLAGIEIHRRHDRLFVDLL